MIDQLHSLYGSGRCRSQSVAQRLSYAWCLTVTNPSFLECHHRYDSTHSAGRLVWSSSRDSCMNRYVVTQWWCVSCVTSSIEPLWFQRYPLSVGACINAARPDRFDKAIGEHVSYFIFRDWPKDSCISLWRPHLRAGRFALGLRIA